MAAGSATCATGIDDQAGAGLRTRQKFSRPHCSWTNGKPDASTAPRPPNGPTVSNQHLTGSVGP
ncbi:hypothetical protein GCM10022248_32590 [Nonomuraea soli]